MEITIQCVKCQKKTDHTAIYSDGHVIGWMCNVCENPKTKHNNHRVSGRSSESEQLHNGFK